METALIAHKLTTLVAGAAAIVAVSSLTQSRPTEGLTEAVSINVWVRNE